MEQHYARLTKLKEITDEVSEIAVHVYDQILDRKARR
jgi:hypothetical protein